MSKRAHTIFSEPFSGRLPAVRVLATLLVACVLLPKPSPKPTESTVWKLEKIAVENGDEKFLDDLEQRALLFFTEQSDPATGLTHDRARADGTDSHAPASIAASGFALTAWCIGDVRGWLPHEEAIRRSLTLLRFVLDNVDQERGWIYHFVDIKNGHRMWRSEASTIDTALFLKGCLMAREYLAVPEVTKLVDQIYERIDWQWALNGGTTLTHGWRPETGFIKSRWDSYSEMLGMYLLGIGAPSNALPAATWQSWRRGPVITYHDRTFISCPPLFTHQFPQAWFDFRNNYDGLTDYWQNSVDATLAQREWCAELHGTFASWSVDMWGVTASDSAKGYIDWGGPQGDAHNLDGTLVPCAPGGSLPFAPRECLQTLQKMRQTGGSAVYGRYGFADAFNPQNGWVSTDVIAIDVGITLLMAENMRTGFVWNYFMKAPEARRGLELAGFKGRQGPPRAEQHLLAGRM